MTPPISVVESLDRGRADRVGALAGAHGLDGPWAHAARCALDREWALVTAERERYALVTALQVEAMP